MKESKTIMQMLNVSLTKGKSLKIRLMFIFAVFSIVPVSVVILFINISYRKNFINKTEMLMEQSIYNFNAFLGEKLEEAITMSKKASYDMVIEKAWKNYCNDTISEAELYREITGNLKSRYYNDTRYIMSAFYLSEDPQMLYSTTRHPMSFQEMYNSEVMAQARKITLEDTNETFVKIIDDSIYLIRNLYTTTAFTKFGTLIIELNKNKLYEGIPINKAYEYTTYINVNNTGLIYDEIIVNDNKREIINTIKSLYNKNINNALSKNDDNNYLSMLYQQKYNDFHIATSIVIDKNIMYSELRRLTHITVLILLLMIPIYVYVLYFIYVHITEPMKNIMKFLNEVQKGEIGIQMDSKEMPNIEFGYFADSFNNMSSELKNLFDHVYKEQIARKEAKIVALQSQINPHFLNNTLELMNWQARMAGDTEVSKMITALGTLLDYGMDRDNKKLISLSQELMGVDAYLYIASKRFGQRLRVEKEVDEELLNLEVPQLILQPILENAISHGIEKVNIGIIKLKIYRNNNIVYLQVINTGKELTNEEYERVEGILAGDSKYINKSGHTSIGIRNVNERIKLIYGEEYGLTIKNYDEDGLVGVSSLITIPCDM